MLEVDMEEKIEGSGSLKGTFGALSSTWGGMFYKRPESGYWNFSETPLIRIWMKLNASIPGLKFELVTGPAWNSFKYEILDQLVIGEWSEVVIDLRLPDEPEGMLPNLSAVRQISFFTWSFITEPASINWDNITLQIGPYISPRIAISPLNQVVAVNEEVLFSVEVLGGLPPYDYEWYVDDELKGTTTSFLFNSSVPGKYNVTCTVIDSVGNSTSASTSITVVSLPLTPPFPSGLDLFKSEVRGMFVQPGWYIEHNWTLIAETCKNYGINMIVLEVSLYYLWENGQPKYYQTLKTAIDAFHAYGFNVYLLNGPGNEWQLDPSTKAVNSRGEYVNYLSFHKNISRNIIQTLYSFIAENYDFEGFIFDDATGYNGEDIDYSEEAKQEFIKDTGITDVNWPTDVIEGGRYWYKFVEWRMDDVTEFVELMVNAMRAKKPNLLFSMAAFAPYGGSGGWWPYAYAQHVADWIDRGLLDFVSPMIGTRTLYGSDSVDERCRDTLNFFVGCAEGKIPVIPWTCYTTEADPRPIDNFVQAVQIMRSYGLDGWIIWRYGGPGWNRPGYSDIRPYLAALAEAGLLEPVWAIQNFTVTINGNYATISWTTTVPTNATIEYANGKIFYASIVGTDFHYKDINYNSTDSTKIYNSTWSTFHLFTIPITENTKFRIQSIDENGTFIITSKEYSISEFR
jgi:hypothetical protein